MKICNICQILGLVCVQCEKHLNPLHALFLLHAHHTFFPPTCGLCRTKILRLVNNLIGLFCTQHSIAYYFIQQHPAPCRFGQKAMHQHDCRKAQQRKKKILLLFLHCSFVTILKAQQRCWFYYVRVPTENVSRSSHFLYHPKRPRSTRSVILTAVNLLKVFISS